MGGKEVQKWADDFMFSAEEIPFDVNVDGPQVYILQGTPDPLGSVVAFSSMYTGRTVRDKSTITDDERRYHLEQMKATKLKAPLEAVNFHFMVEGVTRSFTHQMVRQRTAVFAQESLRFAVKEDFTGEVVLPPSLQGTIGLRQWCEENGIDHDNRLDIDHYDEFQRETDAQQMRLMWDNDNERVNELYNWLVNKGMPAEDARGRLPHNIATRLNYATNLRNLQDHAGNRLCTQAQFEWRNVWMKIISAMRDYCTLGCRFEHDVHSPFCDNWQWNAIADLFRPVCYLTGQCEFKAEFDRKCSIRGRVDEFHNAGIPSTGWGVEHELADGRRLLPVSPAEWLLDHGAAR